MEDDKEIAQREAWTVAMLMAAARAPATERAIRKATAADKLRLAKINGQRRGRL